MFMTMKNIFGRGGDKHLYKCSENVDKLLKCPIILYIEQGVSFKESHAQRPKTVIFYIHGHE